MRESLFPYCFLPSNGLLNEQLEVEGDCTPKLEKVSLKNHEKLSSLEFIPDWTPYHGNLRYPPNANPPKK